MAAAGESAPLPRELTDALGAIEPSEVEALAAAAGRAPSPEHAIATFSRLVEASDAATLLAWPSEELEALAIVVGSSAYFSRQLIASGDRWPEVVSTYRDGPPTAEELVVAAALTAKDDVATLHRKLRRLATAEMLRIGFRDVLGLATLDETVSSLTRLAEVTTSLAVEHCRRLLVATDGDAIAPGGRPLQFVVLGMGKLGGRELNYSSDIDLVYLYESDAVEEGSRPARPFFTKLASAITKAIGDVTADGQVFRVDLRLRPEGVNGLPVNPVEVALDYYEGWGDTWERGALAKARPIAGDLELGERYLADLAPFLYRRHLDFHTVEDLRSMKDRIDAELALQRPGLRDVKVGRGGIRELEFVVQMLQLVHGGHVPSVRGASTRGAMDALEREGLLSAEEARDLRDAYLFLRNVEHAIQIEEKRQTQTLPQQAQGLRWLARRLGYGTGRRGASAEPDEVSGFERDFARHTRRVHELFVRFLELRPEEGPRPAPSDPLTVALLGQIADGRCEEAAVLLDRLGIPGGVRAAENLARIYQGRLRGPASPQRRRAVEALAPSLLDAVARSSDPERALDGLVEFLIRTGAHTSYLALLGGSPKTMEILVSLFASSPYLAGHLVGHPELIDSLVRADAAAVEPTEEEFASSLSATMPEDPLDEESVLSALRRFRVTELLRIGLNDLAGALEADGVHRALTHLAEACTREAVEAARRLVRTRVEGPWERVRLTVIAMGKLGAREMSYGSDLDLIFVYDTGAPGYDGDAHVVATKWVQKLIALLSIRTGDGVVYEVDARLRPSGRSGPLVTSLERFLEYHREEAELWERQALIRARVLYGEGDAVEAIESAMEDRVWGRGLDPREVDEIAGLRRRVETELSGEDDGRLNIKTGRGGIVDIEFLVQMLQLRHGHEHPEVRARATIEALAALGSVGALEASVAGELADHYRFLRRLEARLRLERDRPVEQLGNDAEAVAPLARRLGYTGERTGEELLEDYRERRERVRGIFEGAFGAGGELR